MQSTAVIVYWSNLLWVYEHIIILLYNQHNQNILKEYFHSMIYSFLD